jgi:hypothetical protein
VRQASIPRTTSSKAFSASSLPGLSRGLINPPHNVASAQPTAPSPLDIKTSSSSSSLVYLLRLLGCIRRHRHGLCCTAICDQAHEALHAT